MSDSTITVIGNVATQPSHKFTKVGEVASFRLASSRSSKTENGWEQQTATYFDVDVWGHMANNLIRTAGIGVGLIVQGYLRTEQWTDEHGQDHYRTKLVARNIGLNLKWQHAKVMKSKDMELNPTAEEVASLVNSGNDAENSDKSFEHHFEHANAA